MIFRLDATHLVEKKRIKKFFIGGPLLTEMCSVSLCFSPLIFFLNTVPLTFPGIIETVNLFLCIFLTAYLENTWKVFKRI
jgi:hypothetical protein